MPEIIEEMPYIPEKGSLGRKYSRDGKPSESSRMVDRLLALPVGHCITLLPETGLPKELDRKRTHWHNAANRAGLKVVSRLVTTSTGDRAVRIWRVAETQ